MPGLVDETREFRRDYLIIQSHCIAHRRNLDSMVSAHRRKMMNLRRQLEEGPPADDIFEVD